MALPLPPGLTPAETAFLCENERIEVVPRQRMESLDLLSGPTPLLRPPHPSALPLWLALLLHRQNRATVLPPAWLSVAALEAILAAEIASPAEFTPGLHEYVTPADAAALPYHYLTLSHLLLTQCATSFPPVALGQLATLVRGIREVRMEKMRAVVGGLEGGGVVSLRGVGGVEVGEVRGFVGGVVGGLRRLGESRETSRRAREAAGGLEGAEDEEEMEMERGTAY